MNKKINTITTALFLLVIFGFGIAFWAIPDKDFSEEENRALQTFPALSAEDWLEGKTSAALTDYYADQFPLRNGWVGLHALCEVGRGSGESGGVLLGENGQLAVRRFDMYLSRTERAENTDFYRHTHVQAGLSGLEALNNNLGAAGIPFTALLAPRTLDVTLGDLSYPAVLSEELVATVESELAARGVDSLNLTTDFRERHEAGEYVYYRTDHHWTTYGAYRAYEALLTAWGMEEDILPASAFTVAEVPDFYGTTHARGGMLWVAPDTLELWTIPEGPFADTRYAVRDGDGNLLIPQGFHDKSYLSTKDKYSVFLSGTHNLLTVTEEGPTGDSDTPRPRLLVARDSFANSLVPFLARHYDVVMVNLTGTVDLSTLSELAVQEGCERVVLVCNLENLVTSDCLTRLG